MTPRAAVPPPRHTSCLSALPALAPPRLTMFLPELSELAGGACDAERWCLVLVDATFSRERTAMGDKRRQSA